MSRACRSLLAVAAVCTAALWSLALVGLASEAPRHPVLAVAAVHADALVVVEAEAIDLATGPAAQISSARHGAWQLDLRVVVAILAASVGLAPLVRSWRVERAAPRLVLAPVRAPRMGSRAPPLL